MIAPTIFLRDNASHHRNVLRGAHSLCELCDKELTGVAIGIAGGMVLRMILGRIYRPRPRDPKPPSRPPPEPIPQNQNRVKRYGQRRRRRNPQRYKSQSSQTRLGRAYQRDTQSRPRAHGKNGRDLQPGSVKEMYLNPTAIRGRRLDKSYAGGCESHAPGRAKSR